MPSGSPTAPCRLSSLCLRCSQIKLSLLLHLIPHPRIHIATHCCLAPPRHQNHQLALLAFAYPPLLASVVSPLTIRYVPAANLFAAVGVGSRGIGSATVPSQPTAPSLRGATPLAAPPSHLHPAAATPLQLHQPRPCIQCICIATMVAAPAKQPTQVARTALAAKDFLSSGLSF